MSKESKKTIIRENSFGLIETVDHVTGEITHSQVPNKSQIKKIESNIPMIKKETPVNKFEIWQYSKALHDQIVGYRLQGLSFVEISELEGMPPVHTIFYWKSKYAEFKIDLENARRDKAEYFYDQIETIAKGTYKKEEVPSARLKMQCYSFLCEKGDPSTFGNKLKVEKEPEVMTLIVDTGIRRKPQSE